MKTIKVSEATGIQLDWMVTTLEKPEACEYGVHDWQGQRRRTVKDGEFLYRWHQSWMQGGPILEREKIAISYDADWIYDPKNVDPDDEPDNGDRWYAEIRNSSHMFVGDYGPTPLVAAMRAYVTSKLGDEVEVPEELL